MSEFRDMVVISQSDLEHGTGRSLLEIIFQMAVKLIKFV